MITRNDCLILLTEMSEDGIDTKEYINELYKSNTVSLNVLKFINANKQLDVLKFYEKIRKSYNDKHSTLYINIVKEVTDPKKVITTLSAMLTQIFLFLYSDACVEKELFLEHVRANEICITLKNFCNTNDIVPCLKLLQFIKADLKALESIK